MLNFYLIDTYYNKNSTKSESDRIVCLIFNKENYSTSTLIIDYNKSQINVSCDCSCILKKKSIKDMFCLFLKKKIDCIHMEWLSLSYFNCRYSDDFTLKKINNFKLFHGQSFTPNGHNIECSICLDNINYNNENTYYCNICKNSVHNKCWNKFIIINPNYCKLNCCICRTGTLRSFIL